MAAPPDQQMNWKLLIQTKRHFRNMQMNILTRPDNIALRFVCNFESNEKYCQYY